MTIKQHWQKVGSFTILIAITAVSRINGYLPIIVIPGIFNPPGHLQIVCDRIEKAHPGTNCTLIQPQNGYTSSLPIWIVYYLYLSRVKAYFETNPDGLHIVAHSQGALISRAIIETTENHPVKTFVSIASPQMGQFGIPDIMNRYSFDTLFDNILPVRMIADFFFFSWLGQYSLSVSGYWKDPQYFSWYLQSNLFLPIINNEIPHDNSETYKKNFETLSSLVLIGGPADRIIKPWQSSQMEFFDDNGNIVKLRDQEMYINNTFGIRTLDETGRLFRHIIPNMSHNGFINNPTCLNDYILHYLT